MRFVCFFPNFVRCFESLTELVGVFLCFFFRFYLFIHERHTQRERQRQAEGEAAPCGEPVGLDPRTLGITTWAEGRHSNAEPPTCPYIGFFFFFISSVLVHWVCDLTSKKFLLILLSMYLKYTFIKLNINATYNSAILLLGRNSISMLNLL